LPASDAGHPCLLALTHYEVDGKPGLALLQRCRSVTV
jgi:hypothetical protein